MVKEGKVVEVSVVPVHSFIEGPLPSGSRGTVDYSNHEMGIKEIVLASPITFILGDEESKAEAKQEMIEIAEFVSDVVQAAFFIQFDRLNDEFRARGGYRAKVQTPDTL